MILPVAKSRGPRCRLQRQAGPAPNDLSLQLFDPGQHSPWINYRVRTLLMQSGIRPGAAAGTVAVMLFVTSIAETYLPHRSAEVTDAVMALSIAVIFALVAKGDEMADAQPRSRSFSIPGGTASAGRPATSISRKPDPESGTRL
jgi:hypothetical protein